MHFGKLRTFEPIQWGFVLFTCTGAVTDVTDSGNGSVTDVTDYGNDSVTDAVYVWKFSDEIDVGHISLFSINTLKWFDKCFDVFLFDL